MNDLKAAELLEAHAKFFRGSPAGEAYGIGAQALRERAELGRIVNKLCEATDDEPPSLFRSRVDRCIGALQNICCDNDA